jgi:hypothetical protein
MMMFLGKKQQRVVRNQMRGMRVTISLVPNKTGWRCIYTGSRVENGTRYTCNGKCHTDAPDKILAVLANSGIVYLHEHLHRMIGKNAAAVLEGKSVPS